MKLLRNLVPLAAVLAIPLAANAQGGQAGASGGAGGQAGASGQGVQIFNQRPTYSVGTLNGAVQKVNLSAGTVTVRSTESGANAKAQSMTFNGTPAQLASLNPGDVVSLSYNNYNGVLWLAPGATGSSNTVNAPFAKQGRITGAIQNMQRAKGEITIHGTAFRIHPQQLQGLLPGQFVNLVYANVGGVDWVANISPVGQAQGMKNNGGLGSASGQMQGAQGAEGAGAQGGQQGQQQQGQQQQGGQQGQQQQGGQQGGQPPSGNTSGGGQQ